MPKRKQEQPKPEYPALLADMDADQVRKAMTDLIAKPLPVLRMLQEMVGVQQEYCHKHHLAATVDPIKLERESINLQVKERFLTDAVCLQHFYGGEFGDEEVEVWMAFLKEWRDEFYTWLDKHFAEVRHAEYMREAPLTEAGQYLMKHVPLEIERMHGTGGPTAQDACDASLFARWGAHKTDLLVEDRRLNAQQKKIKAMILPMMAKSVAYLSFAYGGIDMYGQHWEAIPGSGIF